MLKKHHITRKIYLFFYEKGEHVERASDLKQVVRICKCLACLVLCFEFNYLMNFVNFHSNEMLVL